MRWFSLLVASSVLIFMSGCSLFTYNLPQQFPSAPPARDLSLESGPLKADMVVVYKSKRLMELRKRGKTIREYRISLGKNPEGPKLMKGDKKTPEGLYVLDWRNGKSYYHRSIHISYPNAIDMLRAEEMGVNPGNMIMIHGIPPSYNHAANILKHRDWTSGCIAVNNSEIDEIWNLVNDGTMIYIKP
jgi:murein L,D-transpeptidase YafK